MDTARCGFRKWRTSFISRVFRLGSLSDGKFRKPLEFPFQISFSSRAEEIGALSPGGRTMKIERIEALPLTAKMKPLRIATTTFTECRALIVRITTADGHVGIGESLVRTAPRATKAIVEETFAPMLLGKDPLDAAGLWWEMFSAMRTRGHTKGHFVEALSGVDMALWDIIGKAHKLPLYKALHGFGRKTLPAYASSIFMGEVKEMEAQTKKFLDLGYTALKIKIGMGPEKDEAAVAAIRSMVGKSVELMVDANSAYDARTAIQIGRRLEKYDLVWFEEPVPPYDLRRLPRS